MVPLTGRHTWLTQAHTLLLAPSQCKRAKSASSPQPTFSGPRSISRMFQGLDVHEEHVPSALLRFDKTYRNRIRQGAYYPDPDCVSSTSAACDPDEGNPLSAFRRPEHPCPKHTSVCHTIAYDDQKIYAQTIVPFVFTRAYDEQSIHSKTLNSGRVTKAYDEQSIHAHSMIPYVFQEHTITIP